jgi:large subunit ribosomal protein L4
MEKKTRIVVPVYDMNAKKIEEIELDAQIFDGHVNKTVLYQAITAFRANLRRGLAQTKTRGEVSGGGKKPWKQKGTGRARVGSIRSPLWRHGGILARIFQRASRPKRFAPVLTRKSRRAH